MVLAWSRTTGEKLFETDALKYRKLSPPLVLPEGIVISDSTGMVYVLSLKDGHVLNKLDSQTQASLGLSVPLEGGFLYASRAGNIKAFKLPTTNVK
jgi:outer membrane protein assembly factor BamB